MNIISDKKMKSYKEIKGFSQNKYIRIADILPKWNDIGVKYMSGRVKWQSSTQKDLKIRMI